MCNAQCIDFGKRVLNEELIGGKRVIEVGAYDVNGSLRSVIMPLEPVEYIGVDIEKGPGVDIVCNAEELSERFGMGSFDVVIATEVVEHVRDWRKVISEIKKVCKPSGLILVTAPSCGFPYHGFPSDFWRYEVADMQRIFSDCDIMKLENSPPDKAVPGAEAFLLARKPEDFHEKSLEDYELYSIVTNRRVREIKDSDLKSLYYKIVVLRYFLITRMLSARNKLIAVAEAILKKMKW